MKPAPVLSGVLVMLGVFGLLELGAWLVFRTGFVVRTTKPAVQYPFHPYLGWDNVPNFTYDGALAGGLHRWSVRTDGSGMVATPLFQFDSPDARVVLTGGSAAFGHGQSGNEHTVAAQLELALCRSTGLRVEVHNLAVRGFTSFQEMLRLERFLADHPADVVVSLSGFNDGVAAALEDGREFGLLLHRPDAKVEWVRSMERGDLDAVPVVVKLGLNALRRRSCAVDLLGKLSDRLVPVRPAPLPWRDVPAPDSAEVARRARLAGTNYAMMNALSAQHGARYFMFLQPTAMTRRSLTAPERQAMDSLDHALMSRVLPVMRVFYGTLRSMEGAFPFHDLGGCFDDFAGPAFGDDCHYLDRATPVVASAIGDVITPAVIAAGRRRAPDGRAAAAGPARSAP